MNVDIRRPKAILIYHQDRNLRPGRLHQPRDATDELPPAVIDISPLWRPARYAKAIVVADMIGWFGVGCEALEPLADPEGVQLLIRAVLFRLGAAVLLFPDDRGRLEAEVDAYRRIVTMLPT